MAAYLNSTQAKRKNFQIGDWVVDRETGAPGRVVYRFSDFTLKDVVVVRFANADCAIAVSVDDIKLVQRSRS